MDMRAQRPITGRQLQLASYLANGMSYKEAARVMGVSHRTVEQHAVAIRERSGGRSLVHAIAKLVARGAIIVEGEDNE